MRVALIQLAYSPDIIERTTDKIREASKEADLIILQELHQSPYFCISEDVKGFEWAENFENDLIYWSGVAKDNSVVLVTSLFEKRADGLYHNTAFVFEKDGTVAGKYRKMHIPDDPAFYEKFYFTEGDLGFEPIQTSVGKLGVLICWDQWYPEAARLMTMKGAEVLIYPTAIGWLDEEPKEEQKAQLERWIAIQRSHSIANGIPVITPNRVGFEADPTENVKGITFWGNSFVFDAKGEMIACGSSDKEEIIFAELKREDTKEIRDIWPFFRDRRIEFYGDLTKRWRD
jgi:N-carbamoylputrescine amidase